jgi:hypothetical protein
MADFNGRFFSLRDRNLVSALNNELKNDIAEVLVTLFKIAPNQTNINIYGEVKAGEGKTFFPGLDVYCWIQREDLNGESDGFGGDRSQDLEFRFTEEDLYELQFYPQSGDLIKFNERYYEVDVVFNDRQLLGGQESKNLSFIVKTHYTKLSSINLMNRQTG